MANYSQLPSSQAISPRQPIVSRQELNWEDMVFNCHLNNPQEIPEQTRPDHLLCMALNMTEKEERLDGKLTSKKNIFGSFGIVPQGHSYAGYFNQKPQFLSLSINPQKLLEFAPDWLKPENIELIPNSRMEPDPLITGILMSFKQELAMDNELDNSLIEHLQNALLAHLLRYYCAQKHQLDRPISHTPKKISQAINYINDHLEHDIKLAELAQLLDLSPGYFSHLFQKSVGFSPHQYITQCRIKTAQKLIKNNLDQRLSFPEISRRSGFRSIAIFKRRFTKITGISPSQYRDSL